MSGKRTMNDKARRPLTRSARPARNSAMSTKSKAPGSGGAKPATPGKRAGKTGVAARAGKSPLAEPSAAGPPAAKSEQSVRARQKSQVKGAATQVKTKSVAKPKARPAPAAVAAGPVAIRPVRSRPRVKKVRVSRPKSPVSEARFCVGDVVRHKYYPFRGVIFDIDPVFANTDEWWQSIPEKMRPRKNQPFYHLLAENAETEYIAYVSEQNLLPDNSGVPVRHPQVSEYFVEDDEGRYRPVFMTMLN